MILISFPNNKYNNHINNDKKTIILIKYLATLAFLVNLRKSFILTHKKIIMNIVLIKTNTYKHHDC